MRSYVDTILVPGEQVVFRTRKSVHNYWPRAAVMAIVLAYLAVVFEQMNPPMKAAVAITYFAVAAFMAANAWLEMWSTEIAITNRRVIHKVGLFARKADEQQLARVDSVSFTQSAWDRIFGLGTVLLRGSGVSFTPLKGIEHPVEFTKAAQAAIDAVHKTS